MKFNRSILVRAVVLMSLMASLTVLSSRLQADTGSCAGVNVTLPFTDVQGNGFFCQIAAAYFSGLTNGTTATTYSPLVTVTREQMAAFTTRTLDQSVKRSHTRAALGEWWTNKSSSTFSRLFTETSAANPRFLACDGYTVWVSNTQGNSVSRIDIRTGALICTLTGIPSPEQLVIVSGIVFVASFQSPGGIYFANLSVTTNGAISLFTNNVGSNPVGITYDGQNLWTANGGTGPGTGSISRVHMDNIFVTTFTTGFSQPGGILFDGANLWVTDGGDTRLKRVDPTTGAVLQTIPLSGTIGQPVFDGANLWIPCSGPDKVFVVRGVGGLTGTVLAELTGNGLDGAFTAAFDGERICVTNAAAQSISLWKASDLSPLGAVNIIGSNPTFSPRGICSDGTTFFVGLRQESGFSGIITRL
jgi:DNA-binding beta-propeller fold protein YncE